MLKRIRQLSHKQIEQISLRDLFVIVIPLALIVGWAFWYAYQFVQPAPPNWVVMTTGPEGGSYHALAERYRDILARDDITLELRPSSGAVENLQRLSDDDSDVEIGLVQGGVGNAEDYPSLVSLGNLYYEPLWVFYRGAALGRLGELAGKRLAIGPQGSGGRRLALQLLAANEATRQPTALSDMPLPDAARALKQGRVDAVFVIGGPESPVVQDLLRAPGVRLLSLKQAAAYTRLFPFLSSVVLPQGAIDLARNIPDQDTTLVAPTAMLVAHDGLHPALMTLLVQAAIEIHGSAGIFQRPGEFPTAVAADFPMSEEAGRYYKSGPPFFQRYLPFWIAVLVERLVVLIVPLIVVLIPLMRIVPSLYSWRVRRRIYRWYGALKELENEVRNDPRPGDDAGYLKRLAEIEERARDVRVPLAYFQELYHLRQHILLVRRLITPEHAEAPNKSADNG